MARTPKYNAVIASAEMIRGQSLTRRKGDSSVARQEEVWAFYDSLGEFNFGVTWFANTMSRLRLTAAKKMPGGEEPAIVADGPAADLVAQLAGGIGGQSRLLWSYGNFMPTIGEMYLVGETDSTTTSWRNYSPDMIRSRGRKDAPVTQVRVDDSTWKDLPDESTVTRIWREHPRRWWRALSPGRTAIPIMKELELINRHIASTLTSRLAGAGILVVPSEVTFAPSPEHADAPDPFVAELMDTMVTPIGDPGSASAVVPMVVRVPSQYADAFKHLKFFTEVDRRILNMRDSAINRLATTIDLPAEVLLGLGQTNHWTGWQITEDAFKTHIAPSAELLVDALTQGYLTPALEFVGASGSRGFSTMTLEATIQIKMKNGDFQVVTDQFPLEDFIIWYDNSEVSVKPDHSENVVAAYDRYEVSGRALRRELGLDESDKPTPVEFKEQGLKKMLAHPIAAELAGRELGILSPETAPVAPVQSEEDTAPTNGNGNGAMPRPAGPKPSQTAPAPKVPGLPTTPPRRNP